MAGIIISRALPNNGRYGYWIEAAPYRLNLATSLILFYGKEQFDAIKHYKNFQAGIVLTRDGADGPVDSSVVWKFGRRRVYYKLSQTDATHMLQG